MLKRIIARRTPGSRLDPRLSPRLRSAGFNLELPVFALRNMLLALVIVTLYPVTMCPQGAAPTTRPQPLNEAYCTPPNENAPHRYNVIIVGAGLAGLSAAKELQHLSRSVLILEANNRIGGRAYVGYIGDDKVPIDYGGAWLHGIPTNPLTALVDSMGFKRTRTEINLPYFINDKEASSEEKKVFDHAVEEYED